MSLAGAEAAGARREAASRADSYNLKLGPTLWSITAGLSLQYNDNLEYTPAGRQEDLISRPQLDTAMRWQVSHANAVHLRLGIGYAIYAQNQEFDRLFVTPGSEISFDLYAGNVWINIHDRFAIVEDGYTDPTVTGIADYERVDNAAGISATWDLNKVIVRLGYDHVSYIALGGGHGRPDAQLEVFSSSVGYVLKPHMVTGIEIGGNLVDYTLKGTPGISTAAYSDGTQWSVGSFYDAQVSEYLNGRASVGYTQFLPDAGPGASAGQEFSGIYAQVGLKHRLNKFVDYVVNGGRMLNFTYYGGQVDQYFAGCEAQWHVFQKTRVVTSFGYQHGSQPGPLGETFDWFGPAIRLERRLTAQVTGSLAYQHYWRDSDLPGRDYTVNVVSLTGRYRF